MSIEAGPDQLLATLQFSDSFFPGGATSFSWGLESLKLDAQVTDAEQVFGLLQAQVTHRWAGLDRPLMHLAHRACTPGGDSADAGRSMDALRRLDQLCEAMSLTRGWREASRRLGFTQLRMHADMGVAIARCYLDAVRAAQAHGHLPVVQGAVWAAYELPQDSCDAMAAAGLCTSIVGAALRMGLIGHVDGQRLLTRMRPVIAGVVSQPPPARDDMYSGTPALDIAAMRHESRSARLFAN